MLVAVLVCVLSAQRYGNVLDYAGPNLASDQLIVYSPNVPQGGGPGGGSSGTTTGTTLASAAATAHSIAAALGSHDVVELDSTDASLQHAAAGRNWNGQIYLGTPALLQAFGIKTSQIDPAADVLTMRPGLAGLSTMQLTYGDYGGSKSGGPAAMAGTAPAATASPRTPARRAPACRTR
ncbi:MAG: hypothetical protein ABSF03_24605 [Streptosporangiaceae bacterium]